MENNEEENIDKQREKQMADASEPFANSLKKSAKEVHDAGDEESRHRPDIKGDDPQGPNWNRTSKESDGDTSSTAGVFK